MELRTRTTHGRPVERQPKRDELPATFGEKRPCLKGGCITRLHRYHAGEHCYVHEEESDQ